MCVCVACNLVHFSVPSENFMWQQGPTTLRISCLIASAVQNHEFVSGGHSWWMRLLVAPVAEGTTFFNTESDRSCRPKKVACSAAAWRSGTSFRNHRQTLPGFTLGVCCNAQNGNTTARSMIICLLTKPSRCSICPIDWSRHLMTSDVVL